MEKFAATSACGVVESKRCLSRIENIAAARTRVGVRGSQFSNAAAKWFGKICLLQC